MDRIMIGGLALLAVASPAAAADRRYTLTDFERVQVDGAYNVTLLVGGSSGARASGPSAALDRLSIDVQGKTLRIRTNQSAWGGYPNAQHGPVTINVTTAQLRHAAVNGSGSLSIDRAKAMRLELLVAGSGRIGIRNVETDILSLNLLGSGQFDLAGKTKSLRAEIHGSGGIAGEALVATDAQVIADSAGSVTLAVINSASVTSTGLGDVEIIGSPACTVTAQGSGRVACGSN